MMIYGTREEATKTAGGNAVLQVDGGYITCEWAEAFRRITEEAESLHSIGWHSWDALDLMTAYDFDREHAAAICQELAELETE